MGHAAHFLRRLDRLDDPHVELALRLYNDPELLGATLKRAKLPEGAERLAIALEDPRDGPFIVVTREGRFVTCLGRGMSPGDRPIVTREQLDAAARHVERMRETLAQARFFDANEGLLRKKFKALYDDGPYVSRERIEDIARWEPLLGATLLSACFGTSTDLLDTRALVKNITRPHPRHEEILRRYYETFYACSHLFVLAGISPASRALMSQLAEKHPVVTWAWTGVRHGVGYLLYRALWSTARMGKILMPGQKRRLRSELTFLGTIDAMLGTGILGLAHEKLRAEARKALRAPRKPMEGDPRIGPVGNLLQAVFEVCFDSPEAADEAALNLGRHFFERFAPWLPERYRFERPEDIPPELARALHVSVSDPILIDADRISAAFFILPWLARAEATELYLPADIVDALRRPWSMESTIRLLEMPRREDGVRAPRRVEKTPGRNDPCPCKSGKKYKRCCGAAGVTGGG